MRRGGHHAPTWLKGLPRRRLPRGAKLHTVTSLDLVGRQFRRDRPNELWVTDITEHSTREGKVYCCVVLDTFSRKVVGWSIDSTQTTSLVLNALGMATHRRPDRDGLVMHSDRGVQFTSWAFSHNLTQAGISPRGIARQRQQMRRVLDRSCRTASLAKPDGSSGRHSSESLRQIALTRPPRSAVHSLHCSDVSQSRRPSYHPAMTPIDFRRANAFISAVPTSMDRLQGRRHRRRQPASRTGDRKLAAQRGRSGPPRVPSPESRRLRTRRIPARGSGGASQRRPGARSPPLGRRPHRPERTSGFKAAMHLRRVAVRPTGLDRTFRGRDPTLGALT